MLKIQRTSKEGVEEVVFTVIGEVDAEHLAELERLLGLERDGQSLVLNLRDVTLADRSAMRFLARCEAERIRLDACPAYIRASIDREKGKK